MPETRLAKTRRAYDRMIRILNAVWTRRCGQEGHTWPVTPFGVDAFCVKCGHRAEYGGSDWKGVEQFRPVPEVTVKPLNIIEGERHDPDQWAKHNSGE